jgi:hypothetical protein
MINMSARLYKCAIRGSIIVVGQKLPAVGGMSEIGANDR